MSPERPDAPFFREVSDAATLEAIMGSPRAVLFKHSTRCPVSAYVIDEVMDFAETHPEWPVYVLKVIEHLHAGRGGRGEEGEGAAVVHR